MVQSAGRTGAVVRRAVTGTAGHVLRVNSGAVFSRQESYAAVSDGKAQVTPGWWSIDQQKEQAEVQA